MKNYIIIPKCDFVKLPECHSSEPLGEWKSCNQCPDKGLMMSFDCDIFWLKWQMCESVRRNNSVRAFSRTISTRLNGRAAKNPRRWG